MRSEKGKATADEEYRAVLLGVDVRILRAAKAVVSGARTSTVVGSAWTQC
jgi:hypothetical protein